MHLIYLDESGNTGNNLTDPQQPVFVLCAMIVPEQRWVALEHDLINAISSHVGDPESVEVHGIDIRSGRGPFQGMSVNDRIAFRDLWLNLAVKHQLVVVYRAIEKRRYQKWLLNTFGPGVAINPYVMAFPLVARVVDEYLRSLPSSPLGIFISDENHQIVPDVEKSIRVLRGIEGKLRLRQIVEKGFFIESSKCVPLQLCDLVAFHLRKMEEEKIGVERRSFDQAAYAIVRPLVHRGDEAIFDVIDWLTAQTKK